MKDYTTVLLEDDKGRITIPAMVRKMISEDDKTVYRLNYDSVENKITLQPIGKSELKG